MKLLSLNCNKFAGRKSDGKGEHFQADILDEIAESVKQFLNEASDNLVLLHEVNYRRAFFSHFTAAFSDHDTTLHLPTYITQINRNGKRIRPYGCTLAITKKTSAWEQDESLDLNQQHDYANKSIIMRNKELSVIGVHMPYDLPFWELLNSYYRQHSKKALVIVGDLNVYDQGTDRKEKLEQLLQAGAIDTWTESKKAFDHPTCNTGRRIDYALMSAPAYERFGAIQLQDSYRDDGLSDHSALIVDIK